MNVGELKRALEEAEGILTAAGAKAAGKGVRDFLEILSGRENEDIDVFFDELRRRLSAAAGSSRADRGHAHDDDRIDGYLHSLNGVGTDKAAFAAVFARLRGDRSVTKEDADTIAHGFTGGRNSWPSKAEALAAIKDWFDHKVYDAVKMQQVDQGTPWKAKRA
jgi:hypothetical protein